MKKIVLLLVLFTFLFACSTVYFFVMNNKNEIQLHKYEAIENECIPEVIHNKDLLYLIALSTEGKLFYPTMADIISHKGIEHATHRRPKLIFYYSELNCNSCVEIIIKEIENFRDSIGSDNIVYLSDYKRIRDMQIFKRINHISSEIYNISSLNIPLGKEHVPFLFVLDNNNKIRSVFIPNKEDIKTIKLYLSTIKMKHFGLLEADNDWMTQLKNENNSDSLINKTIVQVDRPYVNLGIFDQRGTKQFFFQLKNAGKQPLIIQKVNTSCGCMIARFDKRPVVQGGIATVVLEYKPGSLGYFSKTADVVCNVSKGFVRLKISGEVVAK